jgi:hypothetical protein
MHFILIYMLPFQFAVSRGPRTLVQCTAVNVRCLLTTFKEGAGNVCLRLVDTSSKRKSGGEATSDS